MQINKLLKSLKSLKSKVDELKKFAQDFEGRKLSSKSVSEQRELLLAYEKYTSMKITGKVNERAAKQMVDDFLASKNKESD